MWVINTTRQKMVVLHTITRFFSLAVSRYGSMKGQFAFLACPVPRVPWQISNKVVCQYQPVNTWTTNIDCVQRIPNGTLSRGNVSLFGLLFYAFNSWAITVNSIIYELGTRDSVAQISALRNIHQGFCTSISHRVDNQQSRSASGRCWRQRYGVLFLLFRPLKKQLSIKKS